MLQPNPDAVLAARELGAELRRLNVIALIGLNRQVPELIVYLVRLTPLTRRLIPKVWQTFPVRVIKSGPVSPA
jgi:hypothetical protein